MKQIICIHGWHIWKNKKEYRQYLQNREYNPREINTLNRKENLQTALGRQYIICRPTMPCKQHATYTEWKIRFEKIVNHPQTQDNLILIGHSLWAIFLVKRLSKHTSPKSIAQLHLVAPARDSEKHKLYTFATKKKDMKRITKQVPDIHIYHSTDDPVCDYTDSELIHSLLHWSMLHRLQNMWHIRQEHFPQLIQSIKKVQLK